LADCSFGNWGSVVVKEMIAKYHSFGLGAGGSQIVGAVGGSSASVLAASMPWLAPVIGINPVLGGAIAGMIAAGSAIASALGVGSGCGQTCIEATQIVNQAEPLFEQNVALYQSGQIDQATAIATFDNMWAAVEQACSGIPGAAGTNCVADRQEGACKWRDVNGECWNWFKGYRDPLLVSNGMENQGVRLIDNINLLYLIGGAAILYAMSEA
jgi:hypothetical protein